MLLRVLKRRYIYREILLSPLEENKRCIIESVDYGSDFLSTDGQLALQGIQVANTIVYEGWKHEQ